MAVNRFMTPAEMPEVSFFQLPQEQMRDALLSAQHQYDDAKDKLTLIGDTSFNYLTNVKNDTDLAKQVYSNLDQGINNVLSKQGDGDLRKIRGDIQSLGREVGRWYKPDGDIGKLQSNYLLYNEWFKKQSEKKDLAPQYLPILAQKMLQKFDESGGSKKGSINLEELEAMPDVPKFFRENKDMVKATLNEYAKSKTNGVYFTDEGEAWKTLSPDEIKRVFGKLLMNDPTYGKFMQQAGRYEYYPEESLPLLVPVEKEYKNEKGEIVKYNDYDVNYKNPFSSALTAVMEGLSEDDYKQTHHLRPDGTTLEWEKWNKEKQTQPLIPGSVDETVTNNGQETIQNLHTNFVGTPQQITALVSAKQEQIKIGQKLIYDTNGQMKEKYQKLFGNIKDKNGKIIDPNVIASAYILSSYDPKYNLGHGSWIDEDMFATLLEKEGYKVTTSLAKDGLKAVYDGFTGLLSDGATDVEELRRLTADYLLTFPISPNYVKVNELQTAFRQNNKNTPDPQSKQIASFTVPKGYKGFEHLQDPDLLQNVASSYNYFVPEGKDHGKSGSLNQYLNDKKVVNSTVRILTEDPNGINPNEPQRQQLVLEILKNPEKPAEGTEIRIVDIQSKTAGPQNAGAASFSNALYQNYEYYKNLHVSNQTGSQGAFNIMDHTQNIATDVDKRNGF